MSANTRFVIIILGIIYELYTIYVMGYHVMHYFQSIRLHLYSIHTVSLLSYLNAFWSQHGI